MKTVGLLSAVVLGELQLSQSRAPRSHTALNERARRVLIEEKEISKGAWGREREFTQQCV